jgi:hypothetical protein
MRPFGVFLSGRRGWLARTGWLRRWFKCDCANHGLNVDGEERCRRAQVGPVGDCKIGSLRPPVDQGEPKVSLTQSLSKLARLRAASP